LVIASEPMSGDRLRAARRGTIDDAEIMVVAPALHRSALRFWLSDADDAIRRETQSSPRRRATGRSR
jgi:hypothetical protein